MGIRFACHVCAKKLNIKTELAGKRGVCPACSTRFRIPLEDTDRSTPLDDPDPSDQLSADQTEETLADREDPSPSLGQSSAAESSAAESSASKTDAGEAGDLLSEDPEVSWYVRPPSGGQYGPATGDILRTWISEGRVAASALLWREGWPQWRVANEVFPSLKLADSSSGSVDLNPSLAGSDSAAAIPDSDQQAVNGGQPGSSRVVQQPGASEHAADFATENAATKTIEPVFSGRSDVGVARRKRSGKRIFWIGVLSAAVLVLTAAIIYLMMVSG